MPLPSRTRLLAGCAVGAIMAAMPSLAHAQAFNGTPSVVTGSASINTSPDGGPGIPATTTVTVFSTETVINWAIFDNLATGNVSFQDAGTVGTFIDGSGLTDYTVLNRLFPVAFGANQSIIQTSSTVTIDGTIQSFISGAGANSIGGHIWFYTPNGLIFGPNARITVGSLIGTTDDIQFTTNCTLTCEGFGNIYGANGLVQFRGSDGALTTVQVDPGAQITASGANAYVALVAPRVVQSGLIDVNGQAAFLAAEQVDMTINAGLFDFTLLVGTDDPNGIVHEGVTRGPASVDSLDAQRMTFVALPKNDAVTMLLSGSIGYQPAIFAFNEGSSIVLSSGFDTADPTFLSGVDGNIDIANTDFRNPVTAWATNDITVAPDGGAVTFERDLRLNAGNAIDVTVQAGEQVLGSGFAQLRAGVPGSGGRIDILTTDGDVELPGGQFVFQSYLDLHASSPGLFNTSGGLPDATGGDITITADGGYIYATSLYASAEGISDCACSSTGNGQGGRITLDVLNGGEIETPYVSAYAGGYGANDFLDGGDGYGGRIVVTDHGGLLDLDYVYLDALGRGGDSAAEGGDGYAGSALVSLGGQQQDWSYLSIYTNAQAGGPGFDAAGLSGSAFGNDLGAVVEVTGPGVLAINDIYVTANAYTQTNGVAGFRGEGGTIRVDVTNGGVLTMLGSLYADASARLSGSSFFSPIADSTPTQVGGDALVTVDGGQLDTYGIEVRAEAATSFATVSAGSATGGDAAVAVLNGGTISLLAGVAGTEDVSISADAFGAPGPMPASATGGLAQLILNDGSFSTAGAVVVSADAGVTSLYEEPPAGPGFAATGGTALVDMQAGSLGTASLAAGNVDVSALGDSRLFLSFGEGGFALDVVLLSTLLPGSGLEVPLAGSGGEGAGGTAGFSMAAGTLAAGTVIVDTSGIGAASSATTEAAPFQSGDGSGGTSSFSVLDATSATLAGLELYANGIGGGGAPAADVGELAALAGSGDGGTAQLTAGNASLSLGLVIEATGTGADGMAHLDTGAGSAGGDGFGGTASLVTLPGGTGSLTLTALDLDAQGYGGHGGASALGLGGDGGEGTGGTASAALSDGAFSIGPFRALADGNGGDGSAGGTGNGAAGLGHGGEAKFLLVDSAAGPTGLRSVGEMQLFASGVGGISGSGAVAPGTGGSVAIAAQVLDPASALDLTGGILALSRGASGAAGTGFSLDISGAILSTTGDVEIDTVRDAVIHAVQPLDVNGTFTLFSRSLTETGLIAADTISITSPEFIDAEQLRSDGTTTLLAVNGPLVVDDLTSFDEVLVQAESVDIGSSGRLIFSLARATAGDMAIATAGDLTIPIASATGSMNLRSFNGLISSATGLLAGADFAAQARNTVDLASVSSGDTTLLQSTLGDVLVDSLSSAGTVAVGGNNVDIAGSGDLTFTAAQSAATMSVSTGGDLALGSVNAGGDLRLRSTLGGLTAAGDVTGGPVFLSADHDIVLAGDLTSNGALSVDTVSSFSVAGAAFAGSADILADLGIDLASLDSGGTTRLSAFDGPVRVDDLRSVGLVTARGRSIDILSTGALTFADLDATAGDLRVGTTGNLSLATSDATGTTTFTSSAGSITATGAVNSGGAFAANGATGVTLPMLNSGGTTLLQAPGGAVDVDQLSSTGAVTARGGAVDILSPGALAFADLDATAGNIRVATGGNLLLNTSDATGTTTFTSSTGSVAATGAVNSGGAFAATGPAGLTFPLVNSGGTTLLRANAGAIDVDQLLSTGAVTAAARSLDIRSTGGLAFDEATATSSDVVITTVGNLTARTLSAERAIDLASQGTFTLQGDARAATIDVVSSDIAIGSEARLGVRGDTLSITLLNGNPDNDTFVGNGSTSAGMYVLDGAEARRLFADSSIFIGVEGEVAAGHGAIEIGDLAMSFGASPANVGTGGTLEISTPGDIAITGDVLISTSSATDTFKIDPRLVTLATDTGSISLLAGEGGPAQGRLEMIGGSIVIATGNVIDQVLGLTDFAGMRALLDQPGGTVQPLRAGSMVFDVDSALFIQNTGASSGFADRRGFTAGGVDIVTRDAATRISINGQLVTGQGTFTGLDVIPRITINGLSAATGGRFDPASTINGCSIGTNCSPPPPEPEPLRPPAPPTSDEIESPGSGETGQNGIAVPGIQLIELVQTAPLITPPLVDEPITGVGNDDLWEPRCDQEDETCAGEGIE